jgi:hypothetical protein
LKQEYEELQRAKQDKRDQQAANQRQALKELQKVVEKTLYGYREVRSIDRKDYIVQQFAKPDRWSLGYKADGDKWLSIVNVAPQFDGDGNIEHLYVSLGKSINSPEPWSICPLSTKDLVSTIKELHRKQHN